MSLPENSIVLFLLVCYYNEEETIKMVEEQILKQDYKNIRIIVTINGAKDLSKFQHLAHIEPRFSFVISQQNIGYLNGADLGLKTFCKTQTLPDFAILSNSDVTIQNMSFISELISKHSNSKNAVIGPSIISSLTGHNQNPMYEHRLSKTRLQLILLFFSNYLLYIIYNTLALIKRKLFMPSANIKNNITKDVYALHGSFIVFKSDYFNSGATLNYPAFLFGEELFIAEQCIKKNLTQQYDSSLSVIHHEHQTTSVFKNRKLLAYHFEALNFIYKTYYKTK